MTTAGPMIDWSPLLRMALLGAVIALGPLVWLWLRHRGAAPAQRLRALTWLTLFLTFDLVLFGAFTRLSDSGLGCPDWPGCYGSASPIGARGEIGAAQAALPDGPVTHGKAWVEMLHRYLATAVGVLITVMATMAWWLRRPGARAGAALPSALPSPWWATLTLAWVIAQGAFGALTVTMKLYPAIVTLHLLGGLGLLALLAAQGQMFGQPRLTLSRGLLALAWAVTALLLVQSALGAWVSSNYAVLACRDFPLCQGQWWPPMDFEQGFTLRRDLGRAADGAYLPFAALTAIHVTHRAVALVVLAAMAWLAWRLSGASRAAAVEGDNDAAVSLRRHAAGLTVLALWQLASGLSNVVLGWPIVAALAHTGGAAALAVLLASVLARARPRAQHAPQPARQTPRPLRA